VVAGNYASILPETAIPPELRRVRTVTIAGLPPRRLAMVSARDAQLSLADQAVRESVHSLVENHKRTREQPTKKVRSRPKRG
jgi:DNA-binding transcriptional LysR family regulator